MEKRNVNVNYFRANSVSFSSILSIGDTVVARPISRGIAVQKEGAIFTQKDEVEFKNYDLFSREATWPKQTSNVQQQVHHHMPHINVQSASFIGLSSSSICQLGSIGKIDAEARMKHFRVLREESHSTQSH